MTVDLASNQAQEERACQFCGIGLGSRSWNHPILLATTAQHQNRLNKHKSKDFNVIAAANQCLFSSNSVSRPPSITSLLTPSSDMKTNDCSISTYHRIYNTTPYAPASLIFHSRSGLPSSPSPSRRMYSRISLRVRTPTNLLSSSITTKRWTRDFRMVSKMVSRRSSMEQV